jgi:lipocalin
LGIKQEFAWVLSRKKTLDQATIDKLHAKLQANGVNAGLFRNTPQDCDN